MNALEEIMSSPPLGEIDPFEALTPRPPKRRSVWNWIIGGLFVSMISIAACGLFAIKNEMFKEWNAALTEFHWLVLVQGDQIQVDEAGRFLRQIDGVVDVNYVSSDDMLERFRNDPDLSQGLSYIEGNPFPPSWKVTWNVDGLNPTKMEEALQDVRNFPGVLDVAFDLPAQRNVHLFRLHWYQAKTVLSLLICAAVIFASFLIGRFLFSVNFKKIDQRSTLLGLASDALFWAVGFFAVFYVLGPQPWALLLGGLVVGACRIAWVNLPEKDA